MNTDLAYNDWEEKAREELIGGEVVMMSPASAGHTFVADNILMIFKNYLRGKKCIPFGDGLLVHLTEEDRFVPDMMVVCDPRKVKSNGVHGAPDLVVEVLSPSTAKNDRKHKKDVYARCGVREYWLVSPAEKSIEQYFLENGQFVLHDVYTQHPDWELEQMSEQEQAAVETHFKCSLFDDLDISLEDIFYHTF